jgi:hypothetical protein
MNLAGLADLDGSHGCRQPAGRRVDAEDHDRIGILIGRVAEVRRRVEPEKARRRGRDSLEISVARRMARPMLTQPGMPGLTK